MIVTFLIVDNLKTVLLYIVFFICIYFFFTFVYKRLLIIIIIIMMFLYSLKAILSNLSKQKYKDVLIFEI